MCLCNPYPTFCILVEYMRAVLDVVSNFEHALFRALSLLQSSRCRVSSWFCFCCSRIDRLLVSQRSAQGAVCATSSDMPVHPHYDKGQARTCSVEPIFRTSYQRTGSMPPPAPIRVQRHVLVHFWAQFLFSLIALRVLTGGLFGVVSLRVATCGLLCLPGC